MNINDLIKDIKTLISNIKDQAKNIKDQVKNIKDPMNIIKDLKNIQFSKNAVIKLKIIGAAILVTILISVISNTYSKYISGSTGNIEGDVSSWQILLNNNDITQNKDSTIKFSPIIENNNHIASDTVAPSSKGYFDINIDASNVTSAFKYNIDFELRNTEIPDLMITKYAIIPENYTEGDNITIVNLTNNSINEQLDYDKSNRFKPFTIRLFFEWFENENAIMNDSADTMAGTTAKDNDTKFIFNATAHFEQILK